MAQHAAVNISGDYDTVEDCVVEYTNSAGLGIGGKHVTIRRCLLQYNGQLGFGVGGAHNLTISQCTVRGNNTKGWDRGWEAGGDKICFSRDVVIEQSRFLENRGSGIWFDIGNENATVRNCLIADNEDAGIFYEISYGLHAHDNVITGNGFDAAAGAWGAAAGIALSSSPDCRIERNLLVGNKEGFNYREQTRTTPQIDGRQDQEVPIWNHDQIVRQQRPGLQPQRSMLGLVRHPRRPPLAGRVARSNGFKARPAPGSHVGAAQTRSRRQRVLRRPGPGSVHLGRGLVRPSPL